MTISPSEKTRGRLTPKNLKIALRLIQETGSVTIERVLPASWVTEMSVACDQFLQNTLNAKKQRKSFLAERKGHVGIFPPFTMPFMDPDAIVNPIAVQIMKALMGADIFCTFYNTNTTWPGSGLQPIHRDTRHLFPELPYALPPAMVVVNIPLVDFTIENGCTEIWPGSHLITDHGVDPELPLEERTADMPSIRTIMPAGSVVVRDMRMWHRGMPNATETIRTMLALVYFRNFLHRSDTMSISKEVWTTLPMRARKIFRYNVIT